MRKTILSVLALASVSLAGCVAVPAYEPYGYGPPPPVVVQPSVSFGYSRYYGGRPYYHHRHWR